MVLTLVLLPALAGVLGGGDGTGHAADHAAGFSFAGYDFGLAGTLAITCLKAVAFIALMLVIGRRVIPWVLHGVAHTGLRELFRLAVLAIALGVAFGAAELFTARPSRLSCPAW
jgi:CPA2 family monovalent cation:H+ antiporter-2